MKTTKDPPTFKSQRKIIDYLYKFRYLTILQTQTLFHHKDSHQIRDWLNDLVYKKYLSLISYPKDKTKAYIFCLAQRAGHILRKEEDIDENFLQWLYKEKSKSVEFINRNLFLVDAYLYFQKNKEKGSEVNFFTKQDLAGYDYFPDPLPDAYIDVKEKEGHTRYFLELFDNNIPNKVLRYRIHYYLNYAEDGEWQENTGDVPFPTLLFVCSSEKRKKHINYFTRALLEDSFNDDIEIFLTTKNNIKFAKDGINIWQKVE